MNKQRPLLEIRFDGEAVGPGRISVSHLLLFLPNLNKALQRVGRVLQRRCDSLHKGWSPQQVTSELELELVSLKEGSPAAVLGFERKNPDLLFPEMDFAYEIIETALDGLNTIQESVADEALPSGYDLSVLMAWSDAGRVFKLGIKEVSIVLTGREAILRASLTSDRIVRIRNRLKEPEVSLRTIEGRLLMADFKERQMQCRVYPSAGSSITCLFDEALKEDILKNILCYVRIQGDARENPISGKISRINIHHIESLESKGGVVSQGSVISQAFWESQTLEELARSQDVQPMAEISMLFGTWPGEEDDGFELAIDELRHQHVEQTDQL